MWKKLRLCGMVLCTGFSDLEMTRSKGIQEAVRYTLRDMSDVIGRVLDRRG
ncbi:MAG TPA: hypothetical protein VLS90_11715 [Thermodesulfobacteriota bacterium]|nr:hypothetical protein [Thermodesulfobacteriota bacterium]